MTARYRVIGSYRSSRAALGAARAGVAAAFLALLAHPALGTSPQPHCLRQGPTTRPALMFADDGLYAFCGCAPDTLTGIGTVHRDGKVITIEHDGPDRLRASLDAAAQTGSATLQTPLRVGQCDVDDTDVADGGCACDFSCILACPPEMHVAGTPRTPGAKVSYPPPAPSDASACGAVTCSVGSGTLFRRGNTIVRCVAEKRAACTFSVTVD
jgi:hypothetical protein